MYTSLSYLLLMSPGHSTASNSFASRTLSEQFQYYQPQSPDSVVHLPVLETATQSIHTRIPQQYSVLILHIFIDIIAEHCYNGLAPIIWMLLDLYLFAEHHRVAPRPETIYKPLHKVIVEITLRLSEILLSSRKRLCTTQVKLRAQLFDRKLAEYRKGRKIAQGRECLQLNIYR